MPKIQLQDVSLYYEITGKGEPVVLIHGLGSSTRDWEYQLPALQAFKVVTFDVRGHGRSDKPPGPYTMKQFATDTAELIRKLEIAPAHIVGLSLGGMIAFQLAADAPELLASMVIVNSGPEVIPRTLQEKFAVYSRFPIVRWLGMRKMGETLSPRLFPKPEHAELRRVFVERWAENDPRAYLDAMRAIVGWSVSAHVPAIQTPTLVVAAEHDYTPNERKAAYVKQMQHARLVVIPDTHHAVASEAPEIFNQTVLDFLNSQPHSRG